MGSIDKMTDELISSIRKNITSAKKMMAAQEETAIALAEELQLQLEEEIANLRKRNADLEELSRTNDHIHFIQVAHILASL